MRRRIRRIAAHLAAAAAALALAGCPGFGATARAPGSARHGAPTIAAAAVPSAVRQAARTHEVPTPAPAEPVAAMAPDGAGAVAAFAARFINWNARSVSGVMSALARASVGQARSAMSLAAAQMAANAEIAQNGIANSGTVEAVAPTRGAGGRFIVVTRERTTATLSDAYDGLAPAWHVTVATATRLPGGGWVVSGWQPEN